MKRLLLVLALSAGLHATDAIKDLDSKTHWCWAMRIDQSGHGYVPCAWVEFLYHPKRFTFFTDGDPVEGDWPAPKQGPIRPERVYQFQPEAGISMPWLDRSDEPYSSHGGDNLTPITTEPTVISQEHQCHIPVEGVWCWSPANNDGHSYVRYPVIWHREK